MFKPSAMSGDVNCNRHTCHMQPAKYSTARIAQTGSGVNEEFPWAKLAMKWSCKKYFSVESCLVANHCLPRLKPRDCRD